jgi:hypothetical protein
MRPGRTNSIIPRSLGPDVNRTALALLLAIPLLAGCIGATTSPAAKAIQAQASEQALYDAIEKAIGTPLADHPGKGSHNLDRVALDDGNNGAAKQPTESYVETAVKNGYAYLCRTGPNQGLVIFDVHDIEHPRQVGYLKLDAGFEADVEVSDDGHWAFWETQRFPTSGQTPSVTDPGANAPHGIHIIDISDKAHPKWVGFTPVLPDGPHSIAYANITGRHILFASAYAFAYAYEGVNVPTAQREIILELDTSLAVPQLKTLYEYTDPAAQQMSPTGRDGMFPHDVSVQVHPLTGRTLAYIAYWDLGVVILDVTDPAHPVKVGQAVDFGPTPYREVHMARAFSGLIAGRHVTAVEPEIGAEPDTGYITFLDTTDPSHPTYLSRWKIPGNGTSEGGSLGPHYFDVAQGRLAMASYSAGFWVVDVHDQANLLHPRTVAYAAVNATGTALPGPLGGVGLGAAATAFDAWWADGTHVLGGDAHGGLAVFRYTGPAPNVDEPASPSSADR